MKKSAVAVLIVFGALPFSACNNGEQNAYMETSTAESNAREAELAEQEVASLAAKEQAQMETAGKATGKKKVAKQTSKSTSVTSRQPSSVKPTHQTGKSVYTVQMGAFKVKENAEKLAAKLKAGGFPVVMRSMNHSKNGELFVVHLEPTPNKSEAEQWQTDLKLKSFDSTLTSHRD